MNYLKLILVALILTTLTIDNATAIYEDVEIGYVGIEKNGQEKGIIKIDLVAKGSYGFMLVPTDHEIHQIRLYITDDTNILEIESEFVPQPNGIIYIHTDKDLSFIDNGWFAASVDITENGRVHDFYYEQYKDEPLVTIKKIKITEDGQQAWIHLLNNDNPNGYSPYTWIELLDENGEIIASNHNPKRSSLSTVSSLMVQALPDQVIKIDKIHSIRMYGKRNRESTVFYHAANTPPLSMLKVKSVKVDEYYIHIQLNNIFDEEHTIDFTHVVLIDKNGSRFGEISMSSLTSTFKIPTHYNTLDKATAGYLIINGVHYPCKIR